MKLRIRHRVAATVALGTALAISIPLHSALSQTAHAASSPAGEKFTLTRVYKAGDVDRYQVSALMVMDAGSVPITRTDSIRYKETTRTASADGARTYVREYEAASSTHNGKETDDLAGEQTLTISENARGILDVKARGGESGNTLVTTEAINSAFVLEKALDPAHPVSVGDTWDADLNMPVPGLQTVSMKTRVKLDSIDTVGGIRQAREVQTGESKVNFGGVDGTLHVEKTIFVDVANGKVLRSDTRCNVDIELGEQTMSIYYHTTLRRLSPGEKPVTPTT